MVKKDIVELTTVDNELTIVVRVLTVLVNELTDVVNVLTLVVIVFSCLVNVVLVIVYTTVKLLLIYELPATCKVYVGLLLFTPI